MQMTKEMVHPTVEIWIFKDFGMLAGNFIDLQSISSQSFPGGPPLRRPFSCLKENYVTWIGVRSISSYYFASHIKCIELPQVRWNMAIRKDIKPYLHALYRASYPLKQVFTFLLKVEVLQVVPVPRHERKQHFKVC